MSAHLEEYLETIPSGLQRNRTRAVLTKRKLFGGHSSEAALIEDYVDRGVAKLTYNFMYGKKRDGLRAPKKPEWSIFDDVHNVGYGISKMGALYADYLLGGSYAMAEMEAEVNARYDRELAETRPKLWSGW